MSAYNMTGFDYLGAEELELPVKISWSRSAIAIAAGALAAALAPKHPVLAFFGIAAVTSNTHAVLAGDRTWKAAVKRVGRHVVATAGALALPKYPAMGYVAGAVAGDLLIDDEGGGIIAEWADYEGVRAPRPRGEVIDVQVVEQPQTTALAKVK